MDPITCPLQKTFVILQVLWSEFSRGARSFVRSFVRRPRSHRVSCSLGGEGGVDLTGLRSRVLLEGKSVLRRFELATLLRRADSGEGGRGEGGGGVLGGMAVKLRGHAKRHPPPPLSLYLFSPRLVLFYFFNAYVASSSSSSSSCSCQVASPSVRGHTEGNWEEKVGRDDFFFFFFFRGCRKGVLFGA